MPSPTPALRQFKIVATYLVEAVFVSYLGILGLVSLTGGFSIALGGISFSAYGFQKPLVIWLISLVLRKIVRGRLCVPFLFPAVIQERLNRLTHLIRQGAASRTIRKRAIFIGCVMVSLVSLAALHNYLQQGLTGQYYRNAEWSGNPFLNVHDRRFNLARTTYDLSQTHDYVSIAWTGVLYLPAPQKLQFTLRVDDGAELLIDEQPVIASYQPGTFSNGVKLEKGFHDVRLRYMQKEGKARFDFSWSPHGSRQARPLWHLVFFPDAPQSWDFLRFQICAIILWVWQTLLLTGAIVILLIGCNRVLAGSGGRIHEHQVYGGLLLLLAVVYLVAAFGGGEPDRVWGFSMWQHLGLPRTVLVLAGAIWLIGIFHRHRTDVERWCLHVSRQCYARKSLIVLLALLGVLLFFTFRSEFINTDGMSFRWLVPKHVFEQEPLQFDEMLEFYVHGIVWRLTNHWWGWSVRLSYQFLSSIGGGIFLMLLCAFARRLFPRFPLAIVGLMFAGGYMQLYFGDVENYTLTSVCLLAYFFATFTYIADDGSLVWPSALLALAMAFHMQSAFLLPSTAFLYGLALKRKRFCQIPLALAVSAAILVLTMLALDVPFERMYRGSWGGYALQSSSMWAFLAFDDYHWQQYQLLALMFPAHILVIPLVWYRRIKMNAINMHLLIATLCMFLYQFNYKALLGVYNDWNLYASASLPLALLVWYNVLNIENLRYKAELLIGFFVLSGVHTSCWIISNHYQ